MSRIGDLFLDQLRRLRAKKALIIEPARDSEYDNRERASDQSAFVKNLLAYIPLAGILVVTVNLLFQVRGNQSVALAIIQNLALSSLALVVTLNLLSFLFPAFIIGLTRVTADRSFSPALRALCMRAQWVLVVLGLAVVSWILMAGAILVAFVAYRASVYVPNAPKASSLVDWLSAPRYPLDGEQRVLWLEGRKRLIRDGMQVTPSALDSELNQLGMPRTLEEIFGVAVERQRKVQIADTKRTSQAIFAVVMTALSLYGFTAVVTKVQFAPLEMITFSGEAEPAVGYIFDASDDGVFVPRDMSSAVRLNPEEIESRVLCRTAQEWGPLPFAFTPSEGADCSPKKPQPQPAPSPSATKEK